METNLLGNGLENCIPVRDLSSSFLALDDDTKVHNIHVARMSYFIANHMQMSEVNTKKLLIAAVVHDIGKSRIPLSIINKHGRLTKEEREIVDTHAYLGYEILKYSGKSVFLEFLHKIREEENIPYMNISVDDREFEDICDMVLLHHGIPKWMTKSGWNIRFMPEISYLALTLRTIDAFCALTTDRSYHQRVNPFLALDEMLVESVVEEGKFVVDVIILFYKLLETSEDSWDVKESVSEYQNREISISDFEEGVQ